MNLNIDAKIKYLKSIKDNKHFIFAFVLLIAVSIYLSHLNKPQISAVQNTTVQADTIIPKGYILFPIQLQNIETIKGVIDQYGVIDVYLGTQNGHSSKKLLSKVKIMQAPFNPNEYALLLPEYLSQKMIAENGPFLGVIQNKSETADFIKPETATQIKPIHIEYQRGS